MARGLEAWITALALVSAVSAASRAQEQLTPFSWAGGTYDTLDLAGDLLVTGRGFQDQVFVHQRTGSDWPLVQTLDDPIMYQAPADFGRAVALGDGFLAVGAPDFNSGFHLDLGTVFVYAWDGAAFVVEQNLWPVVDASQNMRFGYSLAADGDRLLVSSYDLGSGMGDNAHVFRRKAGGWKLEGVLLAPGTQIGWGASAALAWPWAFVGADGKNSVTNGPGAVHVYHHDGASWGFHATIDGAPFGDHAAYGQDLAADGEVLAVSAPGASPRLVTIHLLGDDTLELDRTLVLGQDVPSMNSINCMEVSDGHVILGASGEVESLTRCGDDWESGFRLLMVGRGLAVDGSRLAVQTSSLAAVMVDDPDVDGPMQTVPGGVAGAGGFPSLAWDGLACPGGPVAAHLGSAAPDAPAVLFLGGGTVNWPFLGGTLLVDPLVVLGGLTTDGDGALSLSATWPSDLLPGLELSLQAWVADASAPAGAAGSNAQAGTLP